MSGPAGEPVPAEQFPRENIAADPGLYTYEGDWLFCCFDHPSIRAARIGFGQGGFRWDDYGLAAPPADGRIPLSYRFEAITRDGVEACLFSGTFERHPVELAASARRFKQEGQERFSIEGWPRMRWRFHSPDASLSADLEVSARSAAVWPDCVMPHNTFAMCIAACGVKGTVNGVEVSGAAFYDHPRVRVENNAVPPFGWYLYAPLRFDDGSMLASYYMEDGGGAVDEGYSAGFLTFADGSSRWLASARCRNLRMGPDGNPSAWEAELTGPGVDVRYAVRIEEIPLARLWSSEPHGGGPYVAFPLLMAAEGECVVGRVRSELRGGAGIAEFLARKDYQPLYP
ncbi:MAG: hypothetical protein KIT09_33800 [Bryobacteraceae bacterium]|nr:hypothetical protein [Bryobacteraceae bacterium]